MNERRIGILGGTFDPIHYGHLILAEEVREHMSLDRVVFIPTGNPPHKREIPVTSAEHRYNIAKLAVKDNPCFEVSRIETERTGYSYTVDTIEELKNQYEAPVKLYFIIGADIVPQIVTWKEPERLFRMVEFVVVMRPGNNEQEFQAGVEELSNKYGAKITVVPVTQVDISSTGLRSRVREGLSIKYRLPDAVREYIKENGLYLGAGDE